MLGANIFPWYAAWLVPFLAVVPSAPWIAVTGTVAFAHAFFLGQPWAVPWWARAIEFARSPRGSPGGWPDSRSCSPYLSGPAGDALVHRPASLPECRSAAAA